MPLTATEAYSPVFVERRGLRLALVAYDVTGASSVALDQAAGVARFDLASAEGTIKDARQKADVVVVQLHWGIEYAVEPLPAQCRVARLLVGVGADAVIGHHPHVVQPVEWIERPARRPALPGRPPPAARRATVPHSPRDGTSAVGMIRIVGAGLGRPRHATELLDRGNTTTTTTVRNLPRPPTRYPFGLATASVLSILIESWQPGQTALGPAKAKAVETKFCSTRHVVHTWQVTAACSSTAALSMSPRRTSPIWCRQVQSHGY